MRTFMFMLLAMLSMTGCVTAQESIARKKSNINCEHTSDTFKCVEYLNNYDGDTITFNIPNTHPLFGQNISIRVRDLDTPELRGQPACEKKLAKVAKDRIQTILSKAKRIDLTDVGRDKYFRVLANVVADGQSISSLLLEQGLAYRYDGGTKRKINWCNKAHAVHQVGGE